MEDYRHEGQYIDTPMIKQGLTPEQTVEQFRQLADGHELEKSFETVMEIAEKIRQLGGQVFLTGGAVRDELLGKVPKDFDLEVHGLEKAALESLLSEYGIEQPVGKSFGTYKFPSHFGQIEVALPRRDSQVGDKHTDVEVEILPHLGVTEAARRREFTLGAIYKDVLTGELYDPFHGIDDLESKTLRMVDQKTFGDDALRVLRGAAHAARFGLTVEPETQSVMKTMIEKMGALPKERLREEWSKLLVKGATPSLGIEVLRQVGVLERWYPELQKLWSTPQNTDHHPEGDVGTHTLMVTDAAAEIGRAARLPEAELLELQYAALLHDIGKPDTTKEVEGVIHAYGHEAAGAKPAEEFLEKLGMSAVSIDRISKLVVYHMRPAALYQTREKITDRALRKLAQDVGPTHLRALVLLAEADHRGRGPFTTTQGTTEFPDTTKYHTWWEEQLSRLELDRTPEPILWGRDLVESDRAWPAGPLIGEAVRLAGQLAIEGVTREEVLSIIDQAPSSELAVQQLRQRLTPDASPVETSD